MDEADIRSPSESTLLEIQGEHERATEWLIAIAGADPEDLTGAVDRLGIEFTDLEDDDVDGLEDHDADGLAAEADEKAEHAERPQPSADPAAPEVVTPLPEDDHGLGRSFRKRVSTHQRQAVAERDLARRWIQRDPE